MPAYKVLTDIGFETFTPMVQHLSVKRGRHIAEYVPFIHDLLFVHSTREQLDPMIARIPTLQYRYLKGGKLNDPMVVPEDDMNRFMEAVRQSEKVIYIKPEEVDSNMYGKQVRIIGGALDGHVGTLISRRGSKSKSLQLKLPGLLYARIDVTGMDYIEIRES
ncbi:MAG: UpxY family transcription antiterminator [Bacteroidales bacterium]|nr:UpxY family transcription antiterminator [Bacteroidales bacterium]